MKRTYKTEGIILKRMNLGETDRLITIFSKHYGKTKVLAKGIRRINSRRAPSLELFNHCMLLLHKGKNLDIVSDTKTHASFPRLKKDLHRVGLAYQVAELLDRLLADGQENYHVFMRVLELFASFDKKDIDSKTIDFLLYDFKIFLLQNLGFIPKDREYKNFAIDSFIEDTIERKLKSKTILR